MRTKLAALVVSLVLPAAVAASPGAGTVSSADGASIYNVAPDGGGTVVTKIRGADRTALATQRLRGAFEVPSLAGAPGGLSPDGSTLVLGGHPAAHLSQFALLDTRTLRVRRLLTLRGSYSFDAMSPDASTLFVLRFLSRDGTHYAVQALDVTDSHPVAQTLVEKGEPGETMSGQAVARTTSPDGGWVYTLYDRSGHAPFVHALSTIDKFTVCVDLDNLAGRNDVATMALKLHPRTHTLEVAAAGKPLALVDTKSYEVTTPRPAAAPRRGYPTTDSGTPWWLVLGGTGLALAAALAAAKHLQKQPNPRQI